MKKTEQYITSRFPSGNPAGEGGDQWMTECPVCHHPNKHFYINVNTGASQCKHCEWRTSDVIGLVMKMEKTNRANASYWFSNTHYFSGHIHSGTSSPTTKKIMPRELPVEFRPFDLPYNMYMAYLHFRGISSAQIYYYGIGYCETGRYAGRIIFPVYNDVLEFFVDRYVDPNPLVWQKKLPENPDILKTTGVGTRNTVWPTPKSEVIFNLKIAQQYETVYVVEAVIDALSVGPHAVALLGKACSNVQLQRLVSMGRNIVVMLDADALNKTYDLAERLRIRDVPVGVAPLVHGDPNEYLCKGIPLPQPINWTRKMAQQAKLGGLLK